MGCKGMNTGGCGAKAGDAARHIGAFASVGVESVSLTWTANGQRRAYMPSLPIGRALRSAEFWAEGSRTRNCGNVIVRPGIPEGDVRLIQLDDVDLAASSTLWPLSLFVLQTSSAANRQVWLAVSAGDDSQRIKDILRTTYGADRGASGAVRLAGSVNQKPQYHPDYPIVSLLTVRPGHVISAADLVRHGALPREWAAPLPPCAPSRGIRCDRGWPDYESVLSQAPSARSHPGADRSAADFAWCCFAIRVGWDRDAVAERLFEVSVKARRAGVGYAVRSAEAAWDAVRREYGITDG